MTTQEASFPGILSETRESTSPPVPSLLWDPGAQAPAPTLFKELGGLAPCAHPRGTSSYG